MKERNSCHGDVKGNPKVSVGIPVYNGGTSLERALNSILNQNYANLEVVISDNCSTDNTQEIVRGYLVRDRRVKYVRQDVNLGATENFTRVFGLTTGEYFMWAAADDFRSPEFVSSCLAHLQSDQSAVLCAPKIDGLIPNLPEVRWTTSLKSFSDKTTVLSRYKETLKNFPATALYGLYKSSAVKKTAVFQKFMGSDLVFIQNLSIEGNFIDCKRTLFTYSGRENWNTTDQDYKNIFGKERKPWYYLPFFVVIFHQLVGIYNSKIAPSAKFSLMKILLLHQMGQLILKVTLKLVKYCAPSNSKIRIGEYLYWRFIHSPNVDAKRNFQYREKIIRPIIGQR
jgi:glycosyltransferase involved in cell wall biosynthesis